MNKKQLLNIVTKNDKVKERTTFREQLKMVKWVMNLSECELDLLFEEETFVPEVPKPSSGVKKILNMGIFAAAVALPGGLSLYSAVNYLMADYNYKCAVRCKTNEQNESLCNRQCKLKALNYIVMRLGLEYRRCNSSKDPGKCRKKLLSLIKSYRNKRNRVQANLQLAMRKARLKGKI